MKAPNQKILDNLQTAAQISSHLAGQFNVDARQLRSMGLGWLKKKLEKWYEGAENFRGQFEDRLLYFGTDPDYGIGAVAGADSVTQILERAASLVDAALDQFVDFRKDAWDTRADYTPDIYEHAVHCFEKIARKIEREQNLLSKLGEPGYIGSRLEDE